MTTTSQAPITGVWVVSDNRMLTPDNMQRVKGLLEEATARGEKVVAVSEDLEFRWRPIVVDDEFEEARALACRYEEEIARLHNQIDGILTLAREFRYNDLERVVQARWQDRWP